MYYIYTVFRRFYIIITRTYIEPQSSNIEPRSNYICYTFENNAEIQSTWKLVERFLPIIATEPNQCPRFNTIPCMQGDWYTINNTVNIADITDVALKYDVAWYFSLQVFRGFLSFEYVCWNEMDTDLNYTLLKYYNAEDEADNNYYINQVHPMGSECDNATYLTLQISVDIIGRILLDNLCIQGSFNFTTTTVEPTSPTPLPSKSPTVSPTPRPTLPPTTPTIKTKIDGISIYTYICTYYAYHLNIVSQYIRYNLCL